MVATMASRTELHESALIRTDPPFGGDLVRAEGALCPDGKRRNAHASYDGVADTFFSIPAFVYVGRTRVYGYVTVSTMSGSSVPTEDDPETVRFRPYLYRKNHHLVEPPADCSGVGTVRESYTSYHDKVTVVCPVCSTSVDAERYGSNAVRVGPHKRST